MNLRDRYLALRSPGDVLRVALPRECNSATNVIEHATAHATPAQQRTPVHREADATPYATATQQPPEVRATNTQRDLEPVATQQPGAGSIKARLLRVAGVGECNAQQRNKGCCTCRHRSHVNTCRQPVEAGLTTTFEIYWPDPGHGATCPAWRRFTWDATAQVLVSAVANGWTEAEREAWLADADQDPAAVLDLLGHRP